jgi:fumarate hydratase class II
MTTYRIEKDSLGEIQVPADAYWSAQTQRAVHNFPISGLKQYHAFIWAMAVIKRAAAEVNYDLGLFADRQVGDEVVAGSAIAQAIMQAADEVINGRFQDQFVVDPIQAGAGTSHNMNTNEVIANRANEILGYRLDAPHKPVHPNDHVNMAQSTNDTIPTAIRLSCLWRLADLQQALENLAAAFADKAAEFDDVVKSGRTHLQDAVPVRLGQEFGAYARAIRRDSEKIEAAATGLRRLGIGGTATGTGLNAHPDYHPRMIAALRRLTGLELDYSDDGPSTGLDEIHLPAVQPGSSIMPGKVNPVMAEMLDMAMFQVIGNDLTVLMAGQAGQLELNVMMPIIGYNLCQSVDIVISACNAFQEKCVVGIQANRKKAEGWLALNAILVTALNPVIGYEKGAEIAKEAMASNRTVREVVVEKGYLTAEEADRLLDVRALTQ